MFRPQSGFIFDQQQGGLLDERQEWEKAHEVYQRLGDVTATANLIEQAGLPLVRSGRLTLLYFPYAVMWL